MNKKGDIGIMWMVVIFIVILLLLFPLSKEQKTTEQIAKDKRDSFLYWNDNENKFCNSVGMELNDTYYINHCRIVSCINTTGLATYNFCSNKNKDGNFVEGLAVGWLLFSK